jgi:transcriptional regulator with XRE-family HTH domain
MTPEELKEARLALGLSVTQLADMLGVSHQHARRMTIPPDKGAHRPINRTVARLLRAYLNGYRPPDWPHQ